MKRKSLVFTVVVFILIGCIPISSTEKTQPSQINKLQITSIQLKEERNFSEFYTIDINCIATGKICFGESKLLFQSLMTPNNNKTLPVGFVTDYSWSPDGESIAVASAGDVLIGNLDTQKWVNITNSPEIDESDLKWSRDGAYIYYLACPIIIEGIYGGHGDCKLYRSYPLEKRNVDVFRATSKSINSYDLSPDGQIVIFAVSSSFPVYDMLYQADWNGTKSKQLTSMNASEHSPSFSLDGNHITFVRSTISSADSNDVSDIIMRNLTIGEEINLTENFEGLASSPSFSPDGKWIVFYSFDTDLNANIFLVSVEGGNVIQVTHSNDDINPAWRVLLR